MKAVRFGVSAISGVAFTLALLLLMSVLIQPETDVPESDTARRTPFIWQAERKIEDQLKVIKPEKPLQPDKLPADPADEKIELSLPTNTLNMATVPITDFQIGIGGGYSTDSDFIPVYVPRPSYPHLAQNRGVSGYAVVEVIITTAGGVRDPKLLEEHPERMGFGKAALKAASKLRYKPRVIDGEAEEVPGIIYKFSFQMEN